MPRTASGAIRVDNVRVSFLRIFKPKANDKGDEKFAATLLIDKKHPDYDLLVQQVLISAKEKWKDDTAAVMKAMKLSDKICIHDGDSKPKYPEYHGLMYINAYNDIKPTAYGKDGKVLESDDGTLYSGCYANVIIDTWAQDNEFGQRVNAELMGIQFHADGENLGGGGKTAAASDFDLPDEAASPFDSSADPDNLAALM
jgi:hypothetical protein